MYLLPEEIRVRGRFLALTLWSSFPQVKTKNDGLPDSGVDAFTEPRH